MRKRTLGRSGIEVSALGMGCWAIGGPFYGEDGQPYGWGEVDDEESIRTVRRALDLGVTFFDTAGNYGAGHSEVVLGRALADRRDEVVLASKWGWTFDEATRIAYGPDSSVDYPRRAIDETLRRLGTDRVDLWQLHLNDLPIPQALDLIPALEDLVTVGKIRVYGWSTDDPERAGAFADAGPHCVAVQHSFSILEDGSAMLPVCDRFDLASINRGPLAMGMLTGKFTPQSTLDAADVRSGSPQWLRFFRDGRPVPEWLDRVAAVRDLLTTDGRSLAQGALGYLWARSERTIPIPGCRTVAQIEENAGALRHGPLPTDRIKEIDSLLDGLRVIPEAL